MDTDGFDRLMHSLTGLGPAGVTDSEPLDSGHLLAAQNITLILGEARHRGWSFDEAWSAAINRLQPSQLGGHIDQALDAEMRESRALLEEDRGIWRAAYERRDPSPRERAEQVAACWMRLEGNPRR